MPVLIDDETLAQIKEASEELQAAFTEDDDETLIDKADELLSCTEALPRAGQQTDTGRTASQELDLLRESLDAGATGEVSDHAETVRTYLTPAVPSEEDGDTNLAGTRPVTNQEGAPMPSSSNPTQHRGINNRGDERDLSVVHEGNVTKLIVRDPSRRRSSGLGATVTNIAVLPETARAIAGELGGGEAPVNADHRHQRLNQPRPSRY